VDHFFKWEGEQDLVNDIFVTFFAQHLWNHSSS
jgi:hypothetical protein